MTSTSRVNASAMVVFDKVIEGKVRGKLRCAIQSSRAKFVNIVGRKESRIVQMSTKQAREVSRDFLIE